MSAREAGNWQRLEFNEEGIYAHGYLSLQELNVHCFRLNAEVPRRRRGPWVLVSLFLVILRPFGAAVMCVPHEYEMGGVMKVLVHGVRDGSWILVRG